MAQFSWFYANVCKYNDFIAKNGRKPNRKFKNATYEDLYLSRWATDIATRYRDGTLPEDRRKVIETECPVLYKRCISKGMSFSNNFEEFKDFVETNLDFPKSNSSNAYEKKMYNWIHCKDIEGL